MQYFILRAVELVNAAIAIKREQLGGNHAKATEAIHAWVKDRTGVDVDETMTNEAAQKVVQLFHKSGAVERL